MRVLLIITVIAAIALTACTPRPQIVKRYKSIEYGTEGQGQPADPPRISFVALPVEQEIGGETVFDLSGAGQAALIKSLGDKVSDTDRLLAQVGETLGTRQARPQDINLTRFERRVVFTVERGSRRPADRIQWLKINFTIDSDTMRLVNWNKAVTAYEKIDLGTLSLTQERFGKLTGTIVQEKILELQDLGFEVSATNTLSESQDLRRRIVDLNVAVDGKQTATIDRQGAADRDLDGNTIVDFLLRYTGPTTSSFLFRFRNLWNDDFTPKSALDIALDKYDSTYPETAKPIEASATMAYDLRVVKFGADTLNEGDDAVVVISGHTQQTSAVLVSAEAQALQIHRLGVPNAAATDPKSIVVYDLDAPQACKEPDNREFRFHKYWEAQDFYDWLERSMKTDRFTDKIVITKNNYVLCLWNPETKEKMILRPEHIQQLWIWTDALNVPKQAKDIKP